MLFSDVKEHLHEVNENTREYIKKSISYYKLKVFKLLMMTLTSLSRLLIIGFIAVIAVIFLSLAASIGIGQWLNNMFVGYLIVGLFYVVVACFFYLKRDVFERRMIKRFSESFFNHTEDEFLE